MILQEKLIYHDTPFKSKLTKGYVNSTLIENYTQRILMTRRENTIFYHEQSVEIPKEEPFLCSNTLSCLDYAAQQLDVCIQNTSVSGKCSIS